jgi:hypothetical protein
MRASHEVEKVDLISIRITILLENLPTVRQRIGLCIVYSVIMTHDAIIDAFAFCIH